MTIAVTGAGGFVGGHVLRALAKRTDAPLVAVTRRLIPAERLPAGVRQVALELSSAVPADYDRMGRPDILVHAAWGGLPNYLSLHHFETELPLQFRFLRAMVDAGLPALLVTGTCYEYGMVDGALREDRAPSPTNPYGFAKAALLRQLMFLQTQAPFALTWARLFYMWGDGQAPTSIFPLLQAAIARGDSHFPMSRGEQLRDYLPVAEVAEMLAQIALRRLDAGPVNISSGDPVSVRAMVERWVADAGSSIVPELGRYPFPNYEPLAFWGCSDKRKRLLSTAASTSATGQEIV